ncbi:MAG TPA: hypothetical protein PKJ24_03575, partial [Prolixibacteraceae bacterium]|nr:hypothetical protein [Prolixibacteraceae bacterium]
TFPEIIHTPGFCDHCLPPVETGGYLQNTPTVLYRQKKMWQIPNVLKGQPLHNLRFQPEKNLSESSPAFI